MRITKSIYSDQMISYSSVVSPAIRKSNVYKFTCSTQNRVRLEETDKSSEGARWWLLLGLF